MSEQEKATAKRLNALLAKMTEQGRSVCWITVTATIADSVTARTAYPFRPLQKKEVTRRAPHENH